MTPAEKERDEQLATYGIAASIGLLGAGIYAGLKGWFLLGGVFAVAAIPAGLAIRTMAGTKSNA